jgi:cell wall-associated NlpC family hydrolase
MRRRFFIPLAVAALLPAAAVQAAPKPPAQSWALPQIKQVIANGLMGATDPVSFRPDDPLTQEALDALIAGLAEQAGPPVDPFDPANPGAIAPAGRGDTQPSLATPPRKTANADATVTVAQLDAQLVKALGASDVAAQFARSARTAGLKVPSRFGTEAVARLLGLRTNHPTAQDALELLPGDVATRAEAAYSAARILSFRGFELETLRQSGATFIVPLLTPWQQQLLTTATRFIGYPYIWGGESETAESPFGIQARGGFDCSGFVWRAYKLQAYADEAGLAATLRGRTTYQMSAEVPRAQRIALAELQPADVLFWGAKGTRSKAAEIDHMGIYVGNGWFIHSSEYGVALARLDGWYQTRFAWARRPLAEAGLA